MSMRRLLLLVMKMLFDVIQLIDRLTQELKNYLRPLLFGEMRKRKEKQETKKETKLRKNKIKTNQMKENKNEENENVKMNKT